MLKKHKRIICLLISISMLAIPAVVVSADTDVVYGDLNGDGNVSSDDALVILHCVVGKTTLTDSQKYCGDVSGEGEISTTDALSILHYIVGKITKFPVQEMVHTHSYSKKVYSATCTDMGCVMYVCSCGDTYISSLIDRLSHEFYNGVCTMCGCTYEEYAVDYLKQWLKVYGTYEDEKFEYIFECESDYSEVYGLTYDAETGYVDVWHYQALSYGTSCYTSITLGVDFYWFSFYGDKVYGYIDAESYSKSSSLTYSGYQCEIYTVGQMLSLAKTSVDLLLTSLQYYMFINDIPISLADLGYLSF